MVGPPDPLVGPSERPLSAPIIVTRLARVAPEAGLATAPDSRRSRRENESDERPKGGKMAHSAGADRVAPQDALLGALTTKSSAQIAFTLASS